MRASHLLGWNELFLSTMLTLEARVARWLKMYSPL